MLDAHAAHADARANGVHIVLRRDDGDLRPQSGLACDRLDLLRAGVDFRHFDLEEALDDVRVRAGNNQLRPLSVEAFTSRRSTLRRWFVR